MKRFFLYVLILSSSCAWGQNMQIYKLDKSDQDYIIADIIYIRHSGRGGGVYNFKVEDDDKIYYPFWFFWIYFLYFIQSNKKYKELHLIN